MNGKGVGRNAGPGTCRRARERAHVAERYPLPREERRALVGNVLLSDALMLAAGLAFALLASAIGHGSLRDAVLGGGWWEDLGSSFSPHWSMLAAPLALLACLHVADRLLWPRSRRYREQVMRIRRGVNGELPRLAAPLALALFAAVGLSEELLFRYGICGLLLRVCSDVLALPWAAAAGIAVAVSALVFTLAHVQYKSTFGTALVFCIGVFLALLFLATGSLLVVAVAHWLYDFGDTMAERFLMTREEDYFGGEVPIDEMRRALAEARGQRASR